MKELSEQGMISLIAIKEKALRRAVDFNPIELTHLSVCYFEITEMSRGKGLILSKGCNGCIPGAVNIVYNYLMTLPVEEPKKKEPKLTVTVDSWDDLTKAELWSQIKEKGLTAPTTANKKKLIEVLSNAVD